MALAEFWMATPRETLDFIEAAGWRADQASRRSVTAAWFTEAFARQKRLQSLKSALRETFGMTPDEQQADLEERAERARDWARRLNESRRREREAQRAAEKSDG